MKGSRKGYWLVFLLLAAFTALEVALPQPRFSISRTPLVVALVALALTKAALVLWTFMHLGQERRALKLTFLVPMAFPVLYAVALLADAHWWRDL